MTLNRAMWLSIGPAADAAGVPRRSAFRWIARGAVPFQRIGPRRYVEVDALRRFAANRGYRATLASMNAASLAGTAITPSPADADTIAEIAESAACAAELASALMSRVHRIERLLGIAPNAT